MTSLTTCHSHAV